MSLAIGGTDVPITPNGHQVTYEPTKEIMRTYSGRLRSAITGRGYVRVFRFQTPHLNTSEADTVEGLLNSGGPLDATGTLVEGYAEVYPVDVVRTDAPATARISFGLLDGSLYQPIFMREPDADGFLTFADVGPTDAFWVEDTGDGFWFMTASPGSTTTADEVLHQNFIALAD